jgi:tRNA 2-thiouridine synthesizing protein A
MAEIKADCTGQTCMGPLVETRKAFRKAQAGDIVEVIGIPLQKKKYP